MRVLNVRDLSGIGYVDENIRMTVNQVSPAEKARREILQREAMAKARYLMARNNQARAIAMEQERLRLLKAAGYEENLNRSLRNTGHSVAYAAQRQGDGRVPQYGVKNALLGFVDETNEPNFSQSEVYNAQDFNNCMTNKDVAAYTRFKDFPLVVDAPKGDFGGILVNESGSSDFSTWIVDDVRQDFGYLPRRGR